MRNVKTIAFSALIASLILASCAQQPSASNGTQSAEPSVTVSSSSVAIASPSTASFSDKIDGSVSGGNAPIAKTSVTLWAASAGTPQQLAQVHTGDDGRFSIDVQDTRPSDSILYLVAQGGTAAADKSGSDNPAIRLLAVLGQRAPAHVTINEFTTIASAWTSAQFLAGTSLRGNALSLRIAAGNVANFVDLETGGYGAAIQDDLNGAQTPVDHRR